LNFNPLPHGQRSLRPVFGAERCVGAVFSDSDWAFLCRFSEFWESAGGASGTGNKAEDTGGYGLGLTGDETI
jgi:hypothetical protein